jgi:hypothetical protein
MIDDDNPPVNGMGHDDYEYSDSNVEVEPDENALSSILLKAFNEINELGGKERHTLSQVLGRENYDKLLAKPSVARAVDNWQSSSDKTKGAATRLLALSIARAADTPELAARIEREIRDASVDPFDTGRSAATPSRIPTPSQVVKHRAAVDQRRNGQRVSYQSPKGTDIHMLAKMSDDISRYRKERLRQQKGR